MPFLVLARFLSLSFIHPRLSCSHSRFLARFLNFLSIHNFCFARFPAILFSLAFSRARSQFFAYPHIPWSGLASHNPRSHSFTFCNNPSLKVSHLDLLTVSFFPPVFSFNFVLRHARTFSLSLVSVVLSAFFHHSLPSLPPRLF